MNNTNTCTCTEQKICYSCFSSSIDFLMDNQVKKESKTKRAYNRSTKARVVKCACCGTSFETYSANKLTCSDICAKQRQRQQQAEHQKKYRTKGKGA